LICFPSTSTANINKQPTTLTALDTYNLLD
jgi:hypothetical protein